MVEWIKAYPAVFEKTKDGYSVYFPDMQGCISAGDSIEDSARMAKEAITLHISGMIDNKETPPNINYTEAEKEAKNHLLMLIEPDTLLLQKLIKGKSQRINITIDSNLLELADKRAKELKTNRSKLIESGLEAILGRKQAAKH